MRNRIKPKLYFGAGIITVLSVLLTFPVAAAMYTCVDSTGVKSFSDLPCEMIQAGEAPIDASVKVPATPSKKQGEGESLKYNQSSPAQKKSTQKKPAQNKSTQKKSTGTKENTETNKDQKQAEPTSCIMECLKETNLCVQKCNSEQCRSTCIEATRECQKTNCSKQGTPK